MNRNRQTAQESVAKQNVELPASHRDEQAVVTGQADRALEEALEDDEVREMLNLHNRGKHP